MSIFSWIVLCKNVFTVCHGRQLQLLQLFCMNGADDDGAIFQSGQRMWQFYKCQQQENNEAATPLYYNCPLAAPLQALQSSVLSIILGRRNQGREATMIASNPFSYLRQQNNDGYFLIFSFCFNGVFTLIPAYSLQWAILGIHIYTHISNQYSISVICIYESWNRYIISNNLILIEVFVGVHKLSCSKRKPPLTQFLKEGNELEIYQPKNCCFKTTVTWIYDG